jgi:primosomal protein N' (replication factor Y) (superfamily II helicase)
VNDRFRGPSHGSDAGASQVVEVLLPLALDHPYSYRVAEGVKLAAGDYVRVPLGPRQAVGVVWNAAASPRRSGACAR